MSAPLHPGSEPAEAELKPGESVVLRTLRARREEIAEDTARTRVRRDEELEKLQEQQCDFDHMDGVLTALDAEADEIDRAIEKLTEPPNSSIPEMPRLCEPLPANGRPVSADDLLSPPTISHTCLACGVSWNADVLRCPECWVPEPEHDGSLSLEAAITQAVGAASVCWTDDGIFEDRQARRVADGLLRWIVDRFEAKPMGDPPSDGEEGAYSPNSVLIAAMREQLAGQDWNYGLMAQHLLRHADLREIVTLGLLQKEHEKERTCVVLFSQEDPWTLTPVTGRTTRERALESFRAIEESAQPKYLVADVIA